MKTNHPLEDVFNMEEGSTFDIEKEYGIAERPENAVVPTEAPVDLKDEDDIETEKKIDAVYDAAMETFQNQTAYTEMIEPRYAARNAEVAANYLSIALQAASTKAKVKSDRKKANSAFVPYGNKTTNNLVVADRNTILQMLNSEGKVAGAHGPPTADSVVRQIKID